MVGYLHGEWQWRIPRKSYLRWREFWVRLRSNRFSLESFKEAYQTRSAYFGNQQFTTSHLAFVNCNTALQIHWDWAWTMQDLIIESCTKGLVIVGGVSIILGIGSS